MRREVFPVDGPVALVVRVPTGDVEVETADVSEATVELDAKDDSAIRAVNDALVELRPGGDRPELLVDVQHGFRVGSRKGLRLSIVFGRGPDVRVRIRIPMGSSLEVASEAADLVGTGTFDTASVKTAAGDVRLGDVMGDADVRSVSGDVDVASVGGRAHVNSVSGDAMLRRVDGRATVHSVSGDIEVGEAGASVNVKTISGDAKILSGREGEVAMQSVSGDLTFGLKPGSKLWVDARSTSGSTTSELPLGDRPSSNEGPLVELHAKSVSGDIRVVRA